MKPEGVARIEPRLLDQRMLLEALVGAAPVGIVGIGVVIVDVTERHVAERALARRNDLYAMLSRTNAAIARCTTRKSLFSELCTIAVETGHFRFAWIGVADGDNVSMVASAGADRG